MTNLRFNFNLLICLHYILKEQSISKAAKKMFVTQSAMSKSLSQLRKYLNDPIIIRNKGQIIITPIAKELKGQIDDLVLRAFKILDTAQFSANTSKKCFSILCDEVVSQHLFCDFYKKLSKIFPNISLKIGSPSLTFKQQLKSASADVAILFSKANDANLQYIPLLNDKVVIFINNKHPLCNQKIITKNIKAYNLITTASNIMQEEFIHNLAANTFQQKNIKRYPDIGITFDMLDNLDNIALLPSTTKHLLKKNHNIITKDLPDYVNNKIALNLIWNKNHNESKANQWLRLQLQNFFYKNR